MKVTILSYFKSFNGCHHATDIGVLVTGDRGPCSKYDISIPEGDFKGELEMVWEGEPFKVRMSCVQKLCCMYVHILMSVTCMYH